MNIDSKGKNIKSYIEEITGIKLHHTKTTQNTESTANSAPLNLTDTNGKKIFFKLY